MIENNTPETTSTKAAKVPSLMEKRNNILNAWEQLEADAKFADMSTVQFLVATNPSVDARNAVAQSRTRLSALMSKRMDQEAVVSSLLKRIVYAVRCDPNHGDNSQLYRAMGYVPSQERKAPRAAGFSANPQRQSNGRPFRSVWDRYQWIRAAWEKAEGIALFGVTLQELKAAGDALGQTRDALLQEQTQNASLVGWRKSCDETTAALIRKVVANVICSKDHGVNSALYRAMGYTPNKERKRRSRTNPVTPVTV